LQFLFESKVVIDDNLAAEGNPGQLVAEAPNLEGYFG